MTAIDVRDLKVERSGKAVLHGISFAVQAGKVFALLGGNGAGKSTTLLTLLGFLPVATGSVSLSGISPSHDVKKIRDQVAYLPEAAQKVSIALALLRDTPVLFLDEPTSGLDPIAIDEFNRLVRGLAAEGRTILMVTHDVYGACQVADRIGLLRRGELVGLFGAGDGQQIDTETVHKAFAERAAA